MRRVFIALFATLALISARAEAVTIRDLIELSKAGLGDDVLLALIEVDRTVFTIDLATLKKLKDAGVSDKVIVALIRSGRSSAPELVPAPPPAPGSSSFASTVGSCLASCTISRRPPTMVPIDSTRFLGAGIWSSSTRAVRATSGHMTSSTIPARIGRSRRTSSTWPTASA